MKSNCQEAQYILQTIAARAFKNASRPLEEWPIWKEHVENCPECGATEWPLEQINAMELEAEKR
jgi:hypothetical protein